MKASSIVNKDEIVIQPFTSVFIIEKDILKHGYVVIKDNGRFCGIVTQSDIIETGHNLVIDCIRPKEKVHENDDIHNILDQMILDQQYIVPVFDCNENYVGCVTFFNILHELLSLKSEPQLISINNVIGSDDIEEVKSQFLHELDHNLRNPIQIIYSSIRLYKNAQGNGEREFLIDSIQNNIKKIDSIVSKLFFEYLDNRCN